MYFNAVSQYSEIIFFPNVSRMINVLLQDVFPPMQNLD